MFIIQDKGNAGRSTALGTAIWPRDKSYLFYHVAKNQKYCQECNKTDDWEIANELQGFEGYPLRQYNALSTYAGATIAIGKHEVLTPRLTKPIRIQLNQSTNVIYYVWADSRIKIQWTDTQLDKYVQQTIQTIYPDITEETRAKAAREIINTRHITRIAQVARMTHTDLWTMSLLLNSPTPYTRGWFKYKKARTADQVPEQYFTIIRPAKQQRLLFKVEKDTGVLIEEPYFTGAEIIHPLGTRDITIDDTVISWTENGIQYRENIYEYKKVEYVITTRGRIFWIKNTIVKTLRDMGLIERYEILKELTESSVTTQILNEKTAQQKAQIGRVRQGSVLTISTELLQTKYQCTRNNDVLLFLNRTLHFETRNYIPIIKKEDMYKPIVLIRRIDKPVQKWLLHEIKNASQWSPEKRREVANRTNLFLETLNQFVTKKALTLLDIRKGYWFLIIARTYGMLEWTWINSRIYKLDQSNQIIESLSFPDPPSTSDFIWDNNLYTYSNYGNEVTPLRNVTKLRSFKYKVAQRRKLQTRKERMEFTPWQSMDFTERQMTRIVELIVRHTRAITDRVTLGEKDREKLWEKQKELDIRIQQNNKTQQELEQKLIDLSSEARRLEEKFDNMTRQVTQQLQEELINLTRHYVSEEIKKSLKMIAKAVYELNRENREEFRREILKQTQGLIRSLNQTLLITLKILKASIKNNSAEIIGLEVVVRTLNETTTTSIKKWSERVINNTDTIKKEVDQVNKRIDKMMAELTKRINANQKAIADLRKYVNQVASLLNRTILEMNSRIETLNMKLSTFQLETNKRLRNLTLLLKRTDLQLRRTIGLTRMQLEKQIRNLRDYSDKITGDIRREVEGNKKEIS